LFYKETFLFAIIQSIEITILYCVSSALLSNIHYLCTSIFFPNIYYCYTVCTLHLIYSNILYIQSPTGQHVLCLYYKAHTLNYTRLYIPLTIYFAHFLRFSHICSTYRFFTRTYFCTYTVFNFGKWELSF
jgi:hypothetical protein